MDKILSPIKQRIIEYIKYKQITKESFFSNTEISSSNFKGIGAKSELGGDKIVKIITTYTDLNSDWLLTGEGSMLRDSTAVSPQKSEAELKEDRLLALIESQQRSIENLSNK